MKLHRHSFDDVNVYYASLLSDEEASEIVAANPGNELFEGISSRSRLRERASEYRMLELIADGREFQIAHTDIGSPLLMIEGKPTGISISHSRTELAIAIGSSNEIGVDIENMRPQLLKVTSRFLNTEELDYWTRSPERLLQAWSAKEAAFKALSPGVSGFRAINLVRNIDGTVEASVPYQPTVKFDFIMSPSPLRCIALARVDRNNIV